MKDNKIRLQKHLSQCSVASRRKAEELIKDGKVKVNGHIATLGSKVDPKRDKVTVKGKNVVPVTQKVYIMLHKPRGYVTTVKDELGRKCVLDLLKDVPVKVFPVGRLDRDSEGLLLLTNDGEFANNLTHPSKHVTKTYRVTVEGSVTEDQVTKLCAGVDIGDAVTKPCDCFVIERREDKTVLIFTISQGLNRQIRRMCAAVGLNVVRLKRTEIAGVKLGMLKQGMWRDLNEREMKRLTSVSSSKSEV